jgi:RNA polymerase sigma factor (sigma-70 family)
MFGKHLHRRNPAQAPARSDTAALFSRYDRKLRDRVSAVVNTSQANIEDACMFAWVQLLRHEIDEVDAAYSWLTTVAIREAVKLDRADRRTRPLPVDERGAVIEPIDPRDELAARDMLDHAAAVIQEAGLTSRQLEMISLQAWGLTYEQICERTGNSRRTVERQILRARAKLAQALRTNSQ